MPDISENPSTPKRGRALAWVAIIVGVLLCLGLLSSLANQNGTDTSGGAETAGAVVGRLIVLALGIGAIIFGVRRLRR